MVETAGPEAAEDVVGTTIMPEAALPADLEAGTAEPGHSAKALQASWVEATKIATAYLLAEMAAGLPYLVEWAGNPDLTSRIF